MFQTTLLVIEFLVVGIMADIWIVVLIDKFLIDKFLTVRFLSAPLVVEVITAYIPIIVLVVIPLSYVIGCLINGLSHFALVSCDKRIRRKEIGGTDFDESTRTYHNMRYYLYVRSSTVVSFLDHLHSFVRIYRAAILNFAMIAIATIVNPLSKEIICPLVIPTLAILCCIGAFLAWHKQQGRLYEQTKLAYQIITKVLKETNKCLLEDKAKGAL